MTARPTIIEFVEHYTHKFAEHTFLREKVADKWTETSYEQTRKESYRIGAGLMAMGLRETRSPCFPKDAICG
jgi:long-subunit acyl-CoA synthetase (AMP-forming)